MVKIGKTVSRSTGPILWGTFGSGQLEKARHHVVFYKAQIESRVFGYEQTSDAFIHGGFAARQKQNDD